MRHIVQVNDEFHEIIRGRAGSCRDIITNEGPRGMQHVREWILRR
jgi:hypothetical protein